MTLSQVGKPVGVTPQSVGQWERNVSSPTRKRLAMVAAILKQDVGDLLAGKIKTVGQDVQRLHAADHKMESVSILIPEGAGKSGLSRVVARALSEVVMVVEVSMRDWTAKTQTLRELPSIGAWHFPRRVFTDPYTDADSLRVMRLSTNVMAPALQSLDYVIVDTHINTVEGARSVYCLSDGISTSVRRIEVVQRDGDKAPLYRITADNEHVAPREVVPANVRVLGCIVGRLTMTI